MTVAMMNLTAALNITTPLLIIGAALPRTATTSIAAALEQLGYKVFHASTKTKAFWPIWDDICDADSTRPRNQQAYNQAFDKFVQQLSLEGFNATLDQPSCFVYEKLMEYYPDAKVLQTQRSGASDWAKSMIEMSYTTDLYKWQPPFNYQWNVTKGPYGYWSKKQLGYRDEEIHPRGVPPNSNPYNKLERRSSISMASCKIAYLRYQSRVKRMVPADKLVTFNPAQGDGWEKLCQHFLPSDRICPSDQPFPRLNSKSDGFLLDWNREVAAKVHLHKIHPVLANRNFLVKIVVYGMKRRRGLITFFQKYILSGFGGFGRRRRGKRNNKSRARARTSTTTSSRIMY